MRYLDQFVKSGFMGGASDPMAYKDAQRVSGRLICRPYDWRNRRARRGMRMIEELA